jgi:hypothetical protein
MDDLWNEEAKKKYTSKQKRKAQDIEKAIKSTALAAKKRNAAHGRP